MPRILFLSRLLALILTLLVVATPSVAATQQAPTPLPGITVTGVGEVTAPAETATIVIMLASDGYVYAEAPPMEEPMPIATPEAPDEMVAGVIEALAGAGLPESEIEVFSNPYSGDYGPYGGPMLVTLRFTIEEPTVERISEVLDAAIAAARSSGLYVNMISAIYGVEDCAPLQRQAREAAIADARANGELQAELLDVALGDIVAFRDNPHAALYTGASQITSCTTGGTDMEMIALYGGPPFDPMLPAEVTVQFHVEMTFEILPAAGATSPPRPQPTTPEPGGDNPEIRPIDVVDPTPSS